METETQPFLLKEKELRAAIDENKAIAIKHVFIAASDEKCRKILYDSQSLSGVIETDQGKIPALFNGDLWGAICAAVAQIVDMPPFMRTLVQTTQYVGIELINAALSALPIAMTPGGPMGMAGRQALVLTGANSNARGAMLLAGVPRVQVINPNIIFAERRESGGGGGIKNTTIKDGSGKVKNVYTSIKNAPKYPEGFQGAKNGTEKLNVKNGKLLDELRKIELGKWQKVYKDGYDANGKKISIHYFQSPSGKVFDVDVKFGWSNS